MGEQQNRDMEKALDLSRQQELAKAMQGLSMVAGGVGGAGPQTSGATPGANALAILLNNGGTTDVASKQYKENVDNINKDNKENVGSTTRSCNKTKNGAVNQ